MRNASTKTAMRLKYHLNLKDIAKALGVSVTAVFNVENGNTTSQRISDFYTEENLIKLYENKYRIDLKYSYLEQFGYKSDDDEV